MLRFQSLSYTHVQNTCLYFPMFYPSCCTTKHLSLYCFRRSLSCG